MYLFPIFTFKITSVSQNNLILEYLFFSLRHQDVCEVICEVSLFFFIITTSLVCPTVNVTACLFSQAEISCGTLKNKRWNRVYGSLNSRRIIPRVQQWELLFFMPQTWEHEEIQPVVLNDLRLTNEEGISLYYYDQTVYTMLLLHNMLLVNSKVELALVLKFLTRIFLH